MLIVEGDKGLIISVQILEKRLKCMLYTFNTFSGYWFWFPPHLDFEDYIGFIIQ